MKHQPNHEEPLEEERTASSTATQDASNAPSQDTPAPQAPTKSDSSQGLNAESLLQDLQRTRADFENFRKQVDLQREQAKQIATQATVVKLLPLLDDMGRAITAYPEQLSSLAKSFEKVLASISLQQIDTTPGVDFNPDLHEAVSMDDSEGSREVIAETLRPGYLYAGEVIRPAMVRVTHAA